MSLFTQNLHGSYDNYKYVYPEYHVNSSYTLIEPLKEPEMSSYITATPEVEKNVKLEDLKPEDEVTLSHTGIVSSVNNYTGHVRLKDGARIRVTSGKGLDYTANGIKYTIDRVKKAEPQFNFKSGQVWEDSAGKRYVVINGGGPLKAYTMDDRLVLIKDLQAKPGLKLVFGSK